MLAGTSTEPDGPVTLISCNADHEPSLSLRKSAHVAGPEDVTIVIWLSHMATPVIPPVQIVAASTNVVILFVIMRLLRSSRPGRFTGRMSEGSIAPCDPIYCLGPI